MRLSIKLSAILLAFALIGTGCQTITSSYFKSEVQVHKLPQSQTYEAQFKITTGRGANATVLYSPRIVFKAGEPAKMSIAKDGMTLYAEAYVSAQGDDPLCLCKTRIRKDGKYIFHHSEIVIPISAVDNKAEARLHIAPFKILDERGNPVITMDKSGVLRVGKTIAGKIDSEGNIWNKDGTQITHLQQDGTLLWDDGKPIGKVHPDGSFESVDGKVVTWTPEGRLEIKKMKFTLMPADSSIRRTASLAFLLNYSARAVPNKSEQ